jgi:hypothetical protein
MNKTKSLQAFAWGLSIVVCVIAVMAWLPSLHGRFSSISSYKLFPLFGLLAFSLMWAHYIVAGLRVFFGIPKEVLANYFEVTSLAVLAVLLLHPGLLVWQLWRDGFGLPPGSYLDNYVAPSLGWVALLGTVSWFVFLTYELRRKFRNRSWWKYIQYASDAALAAVFYHSLRLGTNLQEGWLRSLWYFYGITYIIALFIIYQHKFTVAKYNKST